MTLSKSDISLIRSLSRKKERQEKRLFVVEGEKMVEELLSSTIEISAIYKEDEIGKDMMSRITHLTTPSPILALAKIPHCDKTISTKGLSLALDSVRDPGNMGTIIRLADWFGIENIYASEDCVDIYNSKTVQATMGAIFRKKVTYIDLNKLVSTYLEDKIEVYGTFLDGENLYNKEINNKENGLIIMGSENNGISSELEALVTQKLYIPPYPPESNTSESLNVAIATAIICAEFRRN